MPAKKPARNGSAARKPKKLVEIDLTETEPVKVDLEPAPRPGRPPANLQAGERVHQRGGGDFVGIVWEVKGKQALVHWGTSDNREILSWVSLSMLRRSKVKVVSPEEVQRRQAERIGTAYRVEGSGDG